MTSNQDQIDTSEMEMEEGILYVCFPNSVMRVYLPDDEDGRDTTPDNNRGASLLSRHSAPSRSSYAHSSLPHMSRSAPNRRDDRNNSQRGESLQHHLPSVPHTRSSVADRRDGNYYSNRGASLPNHHHDPMHTSGVRGSVVHMRGSVPDRRDDCARHGQNTSSVSDNPQLLCPQEAEDTLLSLKQAYQKNKRKAKASKATANDRRSDTRESKKAKMAKAKAKAKAPRTTSKDRSSASKKAKRKTAKRSKSSSEVDASKKVKKSASGIGASTATTSKAQDKSLAVQQGEKKAQDKLKLGKKKAKEAKQAGKEKKVMEIEDDRMGRGDDKLCSKESGDNGNVEQCTDKTKGNEKCTMALQNEPVKNAKESNETHTQWKTMVANLRSAQSASQVQAPSQHGAATNSNATLLANINEMIVERQEALSRLKASRLNTISNPLPGPNLIGATPETLRMYQARLLGNANTLSNPLPGTNLINATRQPAVNFAGLLGNTSVLPNPLLVPSPLPGANLIGSTPDQPLANLAGLLGVRGAHPTTQSLLMQVMGLSSQLGVPKTS